MRKMLRPRLLIVGCGDVGMRLAALARGRLRVVALTSSPGRLAELRAAGITPLVGDLDDRASLWRLAGLAGRVAMLAPPPGQGDTDPRSRRLAQLLRGSAMIDAGRGRFLRLVYVGTTGVYGDCGGARVTETWPPRPASARARRRVDAERSWRDLGRARARVSILRVPGIYDAGTRSPRRRLEQGLPVLRREDDVFTSHVHADDLARMILRALFVGAPNRVYNAADDTRLRMGDYFDLAAGLFGLPRPPRVARADAAAAGLGEASLSFMSESRQIDGARLRAELGLALRYPDVAAGLAAGASSGEDAAPAR